MLYWPGEMPLVEKQLLTGRLATSLDPLLNLDHLQTPFLEEKKKREREKEGEKKKTQNLQVEKERNKKIIYIVLPQQIECPLKMVRTIPWRNNPMEIIFVFLFFF